MLHRSMPASLALATALLASAGATASAQCDSTNGPRLEIAGQVIDARALTPVRARIVVTHLADTLAAVDADSAGAFATTVCRRAGLVAHFGGIGYRSDSLPVPKDSTPWTPLDVALVPDAAVARSEKIIMSGTGKVPRTTAAIAARARRGGGWFIGPDEIAQLAPARVSDLLRGRRGIAIADVGGALGVVSSRAGRPRVTSTAAAAAPDAPRIHSGTETCPLRLGVDGTLMAEEFRMDEVPTATLLAVEVYPSASSMPMEFTAVGRSKICGLVMLWTLTEGR